MKIKSVFVRPLWRLSVLLLEILQRSLMLFLAFLLLFFWWLAEAPWQESVPALLAPFGITIEKFSGSITDFSVQGIALPLKALPSHHGLDDQNTENRQQANQEIIDGKAEITSLRGQLRLRPWPQPPVLIVQGRGIRIAPPRAPAKPFSLPPPFQLPSVPEILPLSVEIALSDIEIAELALEKLSLTAKNHGADWQWRGEITAITLPLLPKFSVYLSGHYAVAESQLQLNVESNLLNAQQKLSLVGHRDGGTLVFRQEEKNGGQWQIESQVTWHPDYTLRFNWDIERFLLKTWLQQFPDFWQSIEPYWQKVSLGAVNSQGKAFLKTITIKNNIANFALFLDFSLNSQLSDQSLSLTLKNADITPQAIAFENFQLSIGQQIASLQGQASFLSIDLNGQINFPKLSAIYPDFSGSIDSHFQAQGRFPWPKVQAAAAIKNLTLQSLKIAQLDLKLDSQASQSWQRLPALALEANGKDWQMADNRLEKLEFFLNTPGFSLKNFPEALVRDWPQLTLKAKVENVSTAAFALPQSTLNVTIDQRGQANIDNELQDLLLASFPDQKLSSDIQMQGNLAAHTLTVTLRHPNAALRLGVKAGWQDNFWQGQFDELLFTEKQLGVVKLNKKASFSLMPTGKITLNNFCLTQPPLLFCQDVTFSEQVITGKGFLENFSLQQWLPENPALALQGDINSTWQGRLVLNNLQQSQGQIKLTSSPLMANITALAPPLTWQFSPLALDVAWQNGLQAKLQVTGDYGLALAAEGNSNRDGSKITGDLLFEINELSTAILPYVENFGELGASQLSLQAQLAGALNNLQPSGQFALKVAQFLPYASEQPFEKIAFSAKTTDGKSIPFQLIANSEQPLTITGSLNTTADFPTTWQITGEAVKVTDLPEAEVWLTPDIQGAFSLQQGLDLKGKLTIPKARIVIKKLPANTVKVSSDARIVRPEDLPTASENALPFAIQSDIVLILGDDASVEAFDFKSFLQGELRLSQQGEQSEGQGRLILKDGQYRAYGQDLRIDPGFIFFTGPLNAPALDITAFRQKLDNQKVGIRLLGAASAPQVSFLSDPALSDAEALSYLVTGKPLNQLGKGDGDLLQSVLKSSGLDFGNQVLAQIGGRLGLDSLALAEGEGTAFTSGLRLGKYLSPRLYLEYLAGNPDALKVQYQLNKKFKLQLEQSNDYQAVDLLYSFEK